MNSTYASWCTTEKRVCVSYEVFQKGRMQENRFNLEQIMFTLGGSRFKNSGLASKDFGPQCFSAVNHLSDEGKLLQTLRSQDPHLKNVCQMPWFGQSFQI